MKLIKILKERFFPELVSPDQLVPYKKNYLGQVGEYTNKSIAIRQVEKEYAEQNRPFTNAQYEEIFSTLISPEKFFSKENTVLLKKIWQDSKFLVKVLEPLKEMKINYTLDLTGGSVRDFVLGNEIKDLDFMLSIPATHNILISPKESVFSQQELDKVEWNNENSQEQKKIHLVEMCLNRTSDLEKVYTHKDRKEIIGQTIGSSNMLEDEVIKDRLFGVIKMSGKSTNYAMDLLMTDKNKYEFLQEFDLDICKASFCIVNSRFDKEFPNHHKYLISRFSADTDFFADIFNKTLTYNTNNKSKGQIKSSFLKHLPKVREKFPDHKVNIISPKSFNFNFAEKLFFHKELEELIPEKESGPVRKKKI